VRRCFFDWLAQGFFSWTRATRTTRARVPRLELCESRQLLSSVQVTSTADSGPGTLRAALEGGYTGISFAPDLGTITLSSPLPVSTAGTSIYGPATISGGGTTQVFDITAVDELFEYLTITNGVAPKGGYGGGAEVTGSGELFMVGGKFSNCVNGAVWDTGFGADGEVFSAQNVTFADNVGMNGAISTAGAIDPTVQLMNCTFDANKGKPGGNNVSCVYDPMIGGTFQVSGSNFQDNGPGYDFNLGGSSVPSTFSFIQQSSFKDDAAVLETNFAAGFGNQVNLEFNLNLETGCGSGFTATNLINGGDIVFGGNYLTGNYGGAGIQINGYRSANTEVTVAGTTIDHQSNNGVGLGGAIEALPGQTTVVNITNCTFAFGTAQYGAGIFVQPEYAGQPTDPWQIYVVSSTVAYNTAIRQGGGVYMDGSQTPIFAADSTIDADNSAPVYPDFRGRLVQPISVPGGKPVGYNIFSSTQGGSGFAPTDFIGDPGLGSYTNAGAPPYGPGPYAFTLLSTSEGVGTADPATAYSDDEYNISRGASPDKGARQAVQAPVVVIGPVRLPMPVALVASPTSALAPSGLSGTPMILGMTVDPSPFPFPSPFRNRGLPFSVFGRGTLAIG